MCHLPIKRISPLQPQPAQDSFIPVCRSEQSTVGRLWYVPGILLLSGLGFTLAAGGTSELLPVIRGNWIRALVTVLGAFEILMAVSAGPLVTIAVGVIGGAVLMIAPWLAGRAQPATC